MSAADRTSTLTARPSNHRRGFAARGCPGCGGPLVRRVCLRCCGRRDRELWRTLAAPIVTVRLEDLP